MKKALSPLASLRLTVVLFAAAMVLILVGTVAQKYEGNWAVVDRYFHSLWLWIHFGAVIDTYFQAFWQWLPIGAETDQYFRSLWDQWIPFQVADLKIPYPGGYSLCILMLVNLVTAHAVRFKLTWKRAGILLTHAGLILLLTGELVTGLFAVEWQMTIDEGHSANYAEDIREVELAIVDPSPEDHDDMVVVPQSILAGHARDSGGGTGGAGETGGEPIQSRLLPFDIRVLNWMPNAELYGPRNADPQLWRDNLATQGLGKMAVAKEIPRVTGVEGGGVDAPAAYLSLTQNGRDLGTWLVPLHGIGMGDPRQPVTVGDKTYLIELRFKRDYKPYTLHLIDFRHDKFVGTEVARNFSSEVRLVDPEHNEDRTVLIYMNHPLRYRGETFFQSGYVGETRTILQVVRNPGWLMPYVACALVSVGLMVHFGVMLGKFVSRTRR